METTLGQFIASKLPGSKLNEWDLAPRSFDFVIKHKAEGLDNDRLKSWVDEFFRLTHQKHNVDRYLTGTVGLDGKDYTLCITNHVSVKRISGTLIQES